MQNSFWQRSVRRWRRGCGGNKRKVFVKKTYSNEKFVSHWCNKKAAATPPQGQIKAKNGGFYIRRHVISLIMLCQNW